MGTKSSDSIEKIWTTTNTILRQFHPLLDTRRTDLFSRLGYLEGSHIDDLFPVLETVRTLADAVPKIRQSLKASLTRSRSCGHGLSACTRVQVTSVRCRCGSSWTVFQVLQRHSVRRWEDRREA